MSSGTPLYTAAKGYISKDMSRFHVPGHKGVGLSELRELAQYDLTEASGLDSLYEANGAIKATEAEYSRIYGSEGSLLSAGGSTLCIQAMLALAAPDGSKIVAARGAHAAAVNAMALLNLNPVWVYPKISADTGLSGSVSPDALAKTLGENPDAACVYVTSPTFFGEVSDIEALSGICRRYSVPLIVDNAHGAHLKFLTRSLHPMDLGADACCDSLHKTLPVLTGGAALHIKNPAYLPHAKRMTALFGSTSPSYLVMLSADMALNYIETQITEDLARVTSRLTAIAENAGRRGISDVRVTSDAIRMTVSFGSIGYSKSDFAALLTEHRIEPEYLGSDLCVLMASGYNSERDFSRLESLVEQLKLGAPLAVTPIACVRPRQVVSLRSAMLSPGKTIPVAEAAGKVAAGMVAPCPPGIPIVIPGERIDVDVRDMLKIYGIEYVNVV